MNGKSLTNSTLTRKIRVMNGKSLNNSTLNKKQTPVTHLVKSGECKFIRNLTRNQIKKKN